MLMNSPDNSEFIMEARLNLIKFAVELSKRLTTFLLLEELTELQGQFCYNDAELKKYDNNILILKCEQLYNILAEYSTDLADYEITESKLACFKKNIEALVLRQQKSKELLTDEALLP